MSSKKEKPKELGTRWKNKIVKTGVADPRTLVPNPDNWRLHPEEQGKTLDDALKEIGWIQQVIVNQTTGHVVDGHKRLALALEHGEPEVPVVWVNLTVEEEKKALATFDPVGAMAKADMGSYEKLVEGLPTDSIWVRELLKNTSLAAMMELEQDEEKAADAPKDIPEMELHPFEHYDYLVFMFRNDQDFYKVVEQLGIEQVALTIPNATKQKIGLGRVVDGKILVGMLNENNNSK